MTGDKEKEECRSGMNVIVGKKDAATQSYRSVGFSASGPLTWPQIIVRQHQLGIGQARLVGDGRLFEKPSNGRRHRGARGRIGDEHPGHTGEGKGEEEQNG